MSSAILLAVIISILVESEWISPETPSLPFPRYSMVIGAYNESMIMFGGYPSDENWRSMTFNPKTMAFTTGTISQSIDYGGSQTVCHVTCPYL